MTPIWTDVPDKGRNQKPRGFRSRVVFTQVMLRGLMLAREKITSHLISRMSFFLLPTDVSCDVGSSVSKHEHSSPVLSWWSLHIALCDASCFPTVLKINFIRDVSSFFNNLYRNNGIFLSPIQFSDSHFIHHLGAAPGAVIFSRLSRACKGLCLLFVSF